MNNKVIWVLIAVILLLGTILAIKISNNTQEKQMNQIKDYKNNAITNKIENKKINKTPVYNSTKSNNKLIIYIIEFIVYTLLIIGDIQLYIKLGISYGIIEIAIRSIKAFAFSASIWIIISFVPYMLEMYIILFLIMCVSLIVYGVVTIILQFLLCKALNITCWVLALVFIPIVGTIICNIIIGINLADKFEKGIFFKVGLCVLPTVFRPILGLIA